MYYCGYSAERLIEEIEKEININEPVSTETYCSIINETEQLIYSELIREQTVSEVPYSDKICLTDISFDEYFEDVPRASDIYSVFIKDDEKVIELEKTTPERFYRGVQEDYSFTLLGNVMHTHCEDLSENGILLIIRLVRPAMKRVMGNKVIGEIALPIEFKELMKCKLRSETYRLINEDELCAKWSDKYNYHLENFKQFIEARRPAV